VRFFPNNVVHVKNASHKGALDLQPPDALPRETLVNIGKESFAKCFDLKRSSFGGNPTTLIFHSSTQNRI
jgi:hypothetical protein